jgi:hypothetical protein
MVYSHRFFRLLSQGISSSCHLLTRVALSNLLLRLNIGKRQFTIHLICQKCSDKEIKVLTKPPLTGVPFIQQDSSEFVDMLNEMRFGKLSAKSIAKFKSLSRPIEYEDGLEATEL